MTDKLAPLDRVGWLAHESAAFQEWISETGTWRVYAADQPIYNAGDPPDGLYGLAAGTLQVGFPLIGEEPVLLYIAELGFWVGDLAELADIPRLVSLSAATPSRLFHLSGGEIQAGLAARPEFWPAFYRLSAINIRTALRQLAEVLSLTVRARVCRHLLRFSEASSLLEVSQDEMARVVGVARGTMRLCLSELSELGAIDIGYRKLRILDPTILARFRNEQ